MAASVVITGSGGRLAAPGITYAVVSGASDNTWKIYDTPRARPLLGHAPQDDAERFRDR